MPTRAIPLLAGYDVVSRLGRGAGAVISLATERATGRPVAIKHVVRRGPEDDRYLAQAENEWRVGRGVDHPYLRRCYDIARVRRWLRTRELFLVMEYVDGERLEDRRPEDMGEVTAVFRQIAEGLHALHQAGYAHADIKPHNVLLAANGGLKIIDYGQSCPLGHVKKNIQGTADYIAPEQVLRREIDQRTDVYNLGATMYWVVTGKWFKTMIGAAAPGTTRIALESKRDNAPPHELEPRVPLALSKLIMECCETAREARPRDMREVLSRLEVVEHLLGRRGDA